MNPHFYYYKKHNNLKFPHTVNISSALKRNESIHPTNRVETCKKQSYSDRSELCLSDSFLIKTSLCPHPLFWSRLMSDSDGVAAAQMDVYLSLMMSPSQL